MNREFGHVRILGATAMTLERETFQYLRGEGMQVHFDTFKGSWVDAEKAEASIRRLYEHIERLTTAYDEAEK